YRALSCAPGGQCLGRLRELQLRLEEVGLEPVDRRVVESIAEQGFGRRTSDAPTSSDDWFVLLLDDRIANAGVRGGHLRTAMAEYGHDLTHFFSSWFMIDERIDCSAVYPERHR